MEEQKLTTPSEVVDKIIALTFTRHANCTEEEFIKALGIENSRGEDIEVIRSRFALISAITKEFLIMQNKIGLLTELFKIIEKGDIKNETSTNW